MGERIYNFSAGPAVLPEVVLEEAREAIWDVEGSGIGILEHSHRGKLFERVVAECEEDCRSLAGIPEDWKVLFLQGGASTQFFMLPANFLPGDATADYLDTGSWSQKAIAEARLYGAVHVVASSKDANYAYIPDASRLRWSEQPAYAHYTSNNTIFGTQWTAPPTPPGDTWLACDASSDVFSRPFDVERHALLYAGAQKNLGPAGVTLVLIRADLLERAVRELPTMLRYDVHAEHGSLYNTPSSFGIWLMGRVFKWIQSEGGLAGVGERNLEKARLIYDVLDAGGFWRGTARPDSRSLMNITFRAPSEELESRFIAEATRQGLDGLKGHRSVGGMRASVYNAFPRAGCEALAQFMKDFAAKHG